MTRITYEVVEHDGDGPIRLATCSRNRSHRMTRPAEQRSARRTNRSSRRVDGHFIRGQGWPLARGTFGRFRPARDGCRGLNGGVDWLSDQSATISPPSEEEVNQARGIVEHRRR